MNGAMHAQTNCGCSGIVLNVPRLGWTTERLREICACLGYGLDLSDHWFYDDLVRPLGSESALYDPGLDRALHVWSWEVVGTNAQPEINHS